MAHKPECAKSKNPEAACDKNCEAPTTKKCWDCEQEIGASETKCPKCSADVTAAEEEDSLVARSLKRIARKKKAEKKPEPKTPDAPASRYKSPGLAKLFKRNG